MRQLTAFIKKEFTEGIRTGKIYISLVIFFLLGIMSPALAKLTPWMMEMAADQLKEQGIVVQDVPVDAMTSWVQFNKNSFMLFVIFVVLISGIMTTEYQKGTLINMLTKGMARWKVIASKFIYAFLLWTVSYWMCFLVTYSYNAYYWDNSIAEHLFFYAACLYLFGIWMISLIFLMSVCFKNSSGVLGSTAGICAVVYLISMIPKLTEYLPTYLFSSFGLLTGTGELADYYWAMGLTAVTAVVGMIAVNLGFNRKTI